MQQNHSTAQNHTNQSASNANARTADIRAPSREPETPAEKRSRNSRENGRKSKGPVTAEGKAKVAQNACKFGLRAENILSQTQNCATYRSLRDDFIGEYQPAGPSEMRAIERLSYYYFQLNVIWELRTALANDCIDQARSSLYAVKKDNPTVTAKAIENALKDSESALSTFARYEINYERMYQRVIKEIQMLAKTRALRPGIMAGVFEKPEPESEPEPELPPDHEPDDSSQPDHQPNKPTESDQSQPAAENDTIKPSESRKANHSSAFLPYETTQNDTNKPTTRPIATPAEWSIFMAIRKALNDFPEAQQAVNLSIKTMVKANNPDLKF